MMDCPGNLLKSGGRGSDNKSPEWGSGNDFDIPIGFALIRPPSVFTAATRCSDTRRSPSRTP